MAKRIALLYGGKGKEHDVSVMGYEYVRELLSNSEYEILPVYIDESGCWYVRIKNVLSPAYPTSKLGGSLYTGCDLVKIYAAIPLLHGDGGEDGTVQGALECAGIPYVGADVSASAVCLDKAYTKAVASSLGIPTLKGVCAAKNESTDSALKRCKAVINFPMFIKPRRLGSSVGAYPVNDEDDFRRCYPQASREGCGLVMVEERLDNKRELECAYAEIDGERIITPPGEVLINGFYGYGEKYGGKTRTEPRANVTHEIESTVTGYAKILAEAISLRHLARIDFFLSGDTVYFNEINTFPGFTRESLYPKMLERYGIDPGYALLSFVKDALSC